MCVKLPNMTGLVYHVIVIFTSLLIDSGGDGSNGGNGIRADMLMGLAIN